MALAFSATASQVVPAVEAGHDPVHVPQAGLIHGAEFIRSGLDLKLVAADGGELLITNYFATDNPPHLVAPNGTSLDGHTVSLLAGPLAPAQYAQAGTAPAAGTSSVGEVTKLEGEVNVQSADGSTKQLHVGDLVFQSDIISTAKDGLIGIKLVDGTILSLQESGKLVLSEVVYNPSGTSNSALLNVLEGTFSLFAGKIAPTGDMKIQTPIATMGIRGTSILGVNVNSLGGRLSLTQDPNGHIGFINIFNNLNGDLFTVLNTLFSKITLTDNGMLLLSAKTADELAFDQQLTQLLHDFVPQAGPNPQPQSGPPSFFDRPGFQDIIFEGAPSTPENQLLIPSELLIPLIESLLQDPIIQQAIINAIDDQPDAAVLEVGADEGELGVGPDNPEVGGSLPFSFGSSGAGSVGFQTLDGQPVTDSSGNPVTLNGQPLFYSWDAGTNTLTAILPGDEQNPDKPIFALTVDPVTGNFTLTLLSQIDHPLQGADILQLELDFTVIAANGQQATGTLAVNVADAVPTASNDIFVAPNNEDGCDYQSYNFAFILDVSGSMSSDPGVEGFNSRLDLAIAAIELLIGSANVNQIMIVAFNDEQTVLTFTDPESALEFLGNLEASGSTNYDGAINAVIDNWGEGPEGDDHTLIYFLSDGAPNPQSEVGPELQAQWEQFLAANGVDEAFAVGIGDGLGGSEDELDPIAWQPNNADSSPIFVTSEDQLSDTLLGTVSEVFGGNVLTGSVTGAVNDNAGGADDFGADGGRLLSFTIDGITYTYDGESITIGDNVFGIELPGEPVIVDAMLQVTTLQGGQFTVYFDDQDGFKAGDWSYIPREDLECGQCEGYYGENVQYLEYYENEYQGNYDNGYLDLPYENFRYAIIDGDGDISTASLTGFEDPEEGDPLNHIVVGDSLDNSLAGDVAEVEILVGNLGADTFVLNSSTIADYIADYSFNEGDAIDLTGLFGGGPVDMESVDIVDNGPGGGDELQVNGTTVAYLDASAGVNIVVDDSGTTAQVGVNV